jgi:ElaB/YqjD/DUF883 family membrane-anchored ribosome-binding protein
METRSTSELEASTEKLIQDLQALVQDGQALLEVGAQNLSERGQAARERLEAALEAAKETKRKLQHRAMQGAKAADKIVREHPYESIGLAFGVGMLLGVLLNRR